MKNILEYIIINCDKTLTKESQHLDDLEKELINKLQDCVNNDNVLFSPMEVLTVEMALANQKLYDKINIKWLKPNNFKTTPDNINERCIKLIKFKKKINQLAEMVLNTDGLR